jgi:excisionase family DNA binding protein
VNDLEKYIKTDTAITGYTVDEAAVLWGMTENLIRQKIREKKIKAIKRGKNYYIPQSEIDRLLMVDSGDASMKIELKIVKLEAENRNLQMQLETIRTFLKGAAHVLGE